MDDVQLLVDTFYSFGPAKKQRLAEAEEKRRKEKEDQQSNAGGAAPPQATAGGKKAPAAPQPEVPTVEDDELEEKDPNMPDLDLDDVIECLE